jgi:hypothetical protein
MQPYFVSFAAKKPKGKNDIFGRCTLYYKNKIVDEYALNDLEDMIKVQFGYKTVSIIFWRKYET